METAMEDLLAAMRELELSVGAVKSTVDETQHMLREIGAWKPRVNRARLEMGSGITTMSPQLGPVALNPILGLGPATHERATPADLEGGEVSTGGNGDEGRRPGGHGYNNTTSSPDCVMPAKCSTVGFGSNIGEEMDAELLGGRGSDTGSLVQAAPAKTSVVSSSPSIGSMEVVASSLPPVDSAIDKSRRGAPACQQCIATLSTRLVPPLASPSVNEVDANRAEDPNNLSDTLPIKCSVWCSSSNNDSGQQFGTLKLDTRMPTICSTGVFDIDIDVIRARQYKEIVLASLVSTPTTSAVLLTTMPPHTPDRPGLLLDRPPPWPVWMASGMNSTLHRCAWLLPMRHVPPETSSTTIMCVPLAAPLATSPTIRYTHVADHVITISDSGQDDHTEWILHGLVDLTEFHDVRLITMPWDPGEQLIMLWLYSCVCCEENKFEWIWQQQIIEAIIVLSVPSALLMFDVSAVISHVHNHHFLLENWRLLDPSATWYFCLNIGAAEQWTNLRRGHPIAVQSDLVPHLILLQQRLGDWWKCGIAYPMCFSFSGIGKTGITENMLANLSAAVATCEIALPRPSPEFVHFCGDHIGNLTMISVSIPMSWDPGVISQLIQEVVLPESAQQALRDIRITPSDSLAHCQCTWALYWKHLGAHQNCTAYIFLGHTFQAGVMCKTNGHCLILEDALIYELNPLIASKTVLGNYAQYRRAGHQGELLIEKSDPGEEFPQVHPVNDHTAQFLFALMTVPNHDDQVGCVGSSSLTLSWNPGKLLCLEVWFTHLTGKQLGQSSSDKLHQLSADVHRLWDPGGSSHRPAWGQAGFQGGGNVTNWIASGPLWTLGWTLGPSWRTCAIIGKRWNRGRGR